MVLCTQERNFLIMIVVKEIFAVLVLSALIYQPAAAEVGHQFYGGSMSYTMEKQDTGQNVTIELITGWVLGKGPCGPGCNSSDIGRSTRPTRPMAAVYPDYLGNFTAELLNTTTKTTQQYSIDDIVLASFEERIIGVSEHGNWEQELLHFNFIMPNMTGELDINFDGFSWRKLSIQKASGKWHLQTTVSTKIRSDTGKTNQSPRSVTKPYYRVKLGTTTEIQIPAVDADGDLIKCDMAQYREGGGLSVYPPPNVDVFDNCSVFVNASRSSNYTDDTWIGVAVSVRDYNREKIVYGNYEYMPAKFSMSTTAVQFLVQVLDNLVPPEFVEPTLEGNHIFIMYADTTWRTDIYAKAPENSTIDSFTALGIQQENLTLSDLQQDPNRPQVKKSIMSWKPSAGEIGRHIACISSSDSTGVESSEQRCFILDVTADAFNYTTSVSPGKPYFVDIPSPNQFVSCKMHVTCVVALFVKSSIEIEDIKVTESYLDNYHLDPIQTVIHKGEQLYQADLSFEHPIHGKEKICFIAKDKQGVESEKVCIFSEIEPPDPCMSAPCLNSGVCVWSKETGGFSCRCFLGYSGKTCNISRADHKIDQTKPYFLPPTLTTESTVLCAFSQPCHFDMHFTKGDAFGFVGRCPTLTKTSQSPVEGVHIFDAQIESGHCTTDVSFVSPTANVEHSLCLQIALPGKTGENICYTVKVANDINDEVISLCRGDTCEHNGKCLADLSSNTPLTSCICTSGFTGDKCQTDIDDCIPEPCQNGGTCEDKVNNYTCKCIPGYTGRDCETVSYSKRSKQEEIAFFVRLNHNLTELGAHQMIPFDDVILNEGHGYNNVIHVFTCPINGVYLFQVAGMADLNEHIEIDIVKDGSQMFGVYSSGIGSNTKYDQGFNTGVIQCDKGQAVWVIVHNHLGSTMRHNHFTTFSGYLLWGTDTTSTAGLKVAFNTLLTSDTLFSNGDTVPFGIVTLNQGLGFNQSSYVFTCPVKGVYMFESALLAGSEQIETDIVKGGVPIVRMYASNTTSAPLHKGFDQGFNAVITQCEKDQDIYVRIHQGIHVLSYSLTTFSGYLIWNKEQDSSSTSQAYEHIAFHSYLSTSLTELGKEQTIPFDRVSLNEGQAFDTFLHAFFCPMDGVYMFRSALTCETNSHIETEIVQDGTPLFRVFASSSTTSNADQGFNAGIVKCNKGQRVWVRVNNHAGTIVRSTTFSGYLLWKTEV